MDNYFRGVPVGKIITTVEDVISHNASVGILSPSGQPTNQVDPPSLPLAPEPPQNTGGSQEEIPAVEASEPVEASESDASDSPKRRRR